MNGLTSNSKQSYLDTIKVGSLVAFFNDNQTKYLSGKVLEVLENNVLLVESNLKSKYYLKKEDVKWVKTGKRWPKGVYKYLKGEI